MPELPEVETVRQTLKQRVLNQKIIDIKVYHDRIVDGDTKVFIDKLINQTILDIERVGKYLIFILEEDAFISHLRMEGKYLYEDENYEINKHTHVVFHLDSTMKLCYHDTRKFGRMELVDKYNYALQKPLSKLGNEPFNSTVEEVYPKLKKSKLAIKTLLLDQSIMTGIGNIYANEICFAMQLNPKTPGNVLSKKRVQELIDVSCIILNKAIEQGGTTIHSFSSQGIDGLFQVSLNVHLQKECKVCGGAVEKFMLNQRGTYFCKNCQFKRR